MFSENDITDFLGYDRSGLESGVVAKEGTDRNRLLHSSEIMKGIIQ